MNQSTSLGIDVNEDDNAIMRFDDDDDNDNISICHFV